MFTQAQIEYIQKQFARGLNKDAIRNKLMDTGWEISDIEDGFREYEKTAPKSDAQISSEINTSAQVAPPSESEAVIPPASPSVGLPPQTEGLQPQVQPQIEVVKTMPIIAVDNSSKSNGGKIFMVIFIIIIVLAALVFAFYKFIYLPKMGAVDTNTASSTVVTLPESSNPPASLSTTTEEIPALPQVDVVAPVDNTTGQADNVEEAEASGSENVENTTPPVGI